MADEKKRKLETRRLKAQGRSLVEIRAMRKNKIIKRRNTMLTNKLESQTVELQAMNAVESQILRMANVERVDPHEIARVLNQAMETEAYTVEKVGQILERARTKLTKAGEVEAARPSDYVSQDTRLRYDRLIAELRLELVQLQGPVMAMARAKLLKTVAEVEKMRDDALGALSAKPGNVVGNMVYVSHLRESGPPSQKPSSGS